MDADQQLIVNSFEISSEYIISVTEFRGNRLIDVPYSYLKWISKSKIANDELKKHCLVLLDPANIDFVKDHQRKISTKIAQRIISQHKHRKPKK